MTLFPPMRAIGDIAWATFSTMAGALSKGVERRDEVGVEGLRLVDVDSHDGPNVVLIDLDGYRTLLFSEETPHLPIGSRFDGARFLVHLLVVGGDGREEVDRLVALGVRVTSPAHQTAH